MLDDGVLIWDIFVVYMLKDQCMLVSFADAVAYQHPEKLREHNISSPVDLVTLWERVKPQHIPNSNPITHIALCEFFGIDVYTCMENKTHFFKPSVPEEVRVKAHARFNALKHSVPPSTYTLHNILYSPNHVEFVPFPTVHTKQTTKYLEEYHTHRKRQMYQVCLMSETYTDPYLMQMDTEACPFDWDDIKLIDN
tara:strand:+ start:2213 stop:2797 length:585 start_codon:yes stop_codon:yes gene_type:complete